MEEYGKAMWTDVNLGSGAYHKWYDGDEIPCSTLNTMNEGLAFKCVYEAGSATSLKRNPKIYVTGVTAKSSSAH
jgi:hypothetical protein